MNNPEKPAKRKQRKPGVPTSPASAAEASAGDAARREKIARIKKALDDGTYHVSNEDVARKVIEHMLQPKK